MVDIEIVKRHSSEFGGVQFSLLDPQELSWRMCAAAGCKFPGKMQMPLPRLQGEPPSWRTLCNQHFVQLVFLMDGFLGSPSPRSEAGRMAEALGVSRDPFVKWDQSMAMIFNPEFARCAECGGSFVAETIGMFSGRRYVHTCGVQK